MSTPTRTSPDLRINGLVRARELAEQGISSGKLQKMVHNGELVRLSRGLYAKPERNVREHDALLQLTVKNPNLVFCLLTALQIHGLTTQMPHELWVAISPKARTPQINIPPLRILRFSEPQAGVIYMPVDDGLSLPVTSIAKTVADCFKFRNKVGLDVALEALREAWHQKLVTMDELWHAASLCRMTNIMRPYLESLV